VYGNEGSEMLTVRPCGL